MSDTELIGLRAEYDGEHGTKRGPRIHAALRRGTDRSIAALIVHPTSDFMGHYLMGPLPDAGITLLALNTRYVGDDAHLIFEHLIADVGAAVRYLRQEGYEKIILLGNSGGASTVALYQSQAENLTITGTPAGDPVSLTPDGLPPADAIALFGAHLGRALVLSKWLDASVTDETDLLSRDSALDIYNPENGPPFSPPFVARIRQQQIARLENITDRVRRRLAELRALPGGPRDEAFVIYRTVADPRFLDLSLDANDRAPGMVFGDPRRLNYGPVDQARFSTLTSWLSQWSPDSRAHGPACIAQTSVPVLTVEFTADTNVLPSDIALWTEALGERQTLRRIKGGTHFLIGQHAHRQTLAGMIADWARQL